MWGQCSAAELQVAPHIACTFEPERLLPQTCAAINPNSTQITDWPKHDWGGHDQAEEELYTKYIYIYIISWQHIITEQSQLFLGYLQVVLLAMHTFICLRRDDSDSRLWVLNMSSHGWRFLCLSVCLCMLVWWHVACGSSSNSTAQISFNTSHQQSHALTF